MPFEMPALSSDTFKDTGFFSRASNPQTAIREKDGQISKSNEALLGDRASFDADSHAKLIGERQEMSQLSGFRNTYKTVKEHGGSGLTAFSHGAQAFGDKAVNKLADHMPDGVANFMREHSGAIAGTTAGLGGAGLMYEGYQSYENNKQSQSYYS